MKRLTILFFLLTFISFKAAAQSDIYGFTARNAAAQEVCMDTYKGQVVLVVNTATHCGFTPQYKELEALYNEFKARGFVILDFPCNQFGTQAPGDIHTIQSFCTEHFQVTFPQFDKVCVNGPDATPLFSYLKSKLPFRGFDLNNPFGQRLDQMFRAQNPDFDKNPDIKWNFTKFLIDRDGHPVQRFEPTEDMQRVREAVEGLL
ncbi:MAG: glutathione peroxidase [Bacteroidaceae bacterium]|nr:glutathione peroxidase [Bacteroidaceae bacterium]